MATPKFAWGVDIGNRALKAIKLVRDGDNLIMEDVDVIEHEQVLSNSGDNKESLIQTALASFAQRHDIKKGTVAIGVSGQSSFARFIKLPPVEKSKIPEIVKFEAIQQIPFPLDDVEWSYQLFENPDSTDVEVGIFAMRKELVNQQIKYFSDMDMNVQVVQMNPLAVYNAMYYDNRVQDGTTMILDLGAENADLIIADGESVWLRSIAIGGNQFTEALVKAFKTNFSKAEDLKRNAQTSKYARQIFQHMRPIFADLVAEIQRSIGFYSSVHRDSRIKKIIALGNTFRLPTLQKYLQQNLQIDVERLDGFSVGVPADGRLAAMLSDNMASMGSAYGLALQAMGQGKIDSSLLPQAIKTEKKWAEKTKWFAAAASIAVLAAGVKFGSWYFHNDRFEANRPSRDQIDTTVTTAQRYHDRWSKIESDGGSAKQTIINVSSMQQYRDLWADLWLDVTRALPLDNGAPKTDLEAKARGKRQQVFVESMASKFYPDMTQIMSMDAEQFKTYVTDPNNAGVVMENRNDVGVRRGNEEGIRRGDADRGIAPQQTPDSTAAAAAVGKRGFVITLQLKSPAEDASTLVESQLLKKLMPAVKEAAEAEAVKQGKSYAIVRTLIVSAQQIKDDPNRLQAIRTAFEAKRTAEQKAANPTEGGNLPNFMNQRDGGGAFPRGGGREGYDGDRGGGRRPLGGGALNPSLVTGGGGGEDPEALKKLEALIYADPNFPKEDIRGDWDVTVLIAVVLDPKAPEKAEEAGTATASSN